MKDLIDRVLQICLLAICLPTGLCASAQIEISGLSWWKNNNLEKRLTFLHGFDGQESVVLDSVLLEDSAYLILEDVKDSGYLEPLLKGHFETQSGTLKVEWASDYEVQLPIGFVAQSAEFKIIEGVRFYYESVTVSGVSAIESEQLQRYFIPGGFLMSADSNVFTYGNLERRIGRLINTLRDLGYREAKVLARQVDVDVETGAVRVEIQIQQGPVYHVGEVQVMQVAADVPPVTFDDTEASGSLIDNDWERGYRIHLRNAAYQLGYPDAQVGVVSEKLPVDSVAQKQLVNYRFEVQRGEKVRLSEIRFEGDPKTNQKVLQQEVGMEPEALLNPLEVNRGQRALMQLGIYREVDLHYEPTTGDERAVVYGLTPSERQALELLGGWGSYEQGRVGFKWNHRNPWGRAHRYEVSAKRSFKATRLESTYSIPYIFDTELTAYTRAEYSHREEISYDRESRGAAVGTAWWLGKSGVRMSVEYGYVQENADRGLGVQLDSQDQATIASFTVRSTLDRRDDFLAPTSGYSLFASYEWADESFGGSVNFYRSEVGGSYHFPILRSLLVHAGLRGGVILTQGDAAENIPFNLRFFNGGENSVRGYREGQASPLETDGEEFGAESYVLLNFELEQRLSQNLSLVEFVDSVYFAREGVFSEGTEWLYSVGVGVRYQTVVGPIRLEYGHNPDARPEDPPGRFHLSVGFPF